MSFKLRCDLTNVSVNEIVQLVQLTATEYAYSVEGALTDNPHVHFYIRGSEKQCPSRHKLRNLCGRGNGSYSMVANDEEYPIEYLAYMLKEGNLINVGIPEDIMDEVIAYNEKVKEGMKKKKEDRKVIWKKILETLPPEVDYLTIVQYVIRYHKENEMLVREFQLKSYVDTLYMIKCPKEFEENMIERLQKR